MRLRLAICLASACLTAGCALHTPERATTKFVHQLRSGLALYDGSAAFERARAGLHLPEVQSRKTASQVVRRSAMWTHDRQQLAIVSSNVLRDPPDRYDLRLSWRPSRKLRAGLLERLLGKPFGTSATSDAGWVIDGGILEYRAAETETPYLVFSSPRYVRDPLDLLESAALPHLPELSSVRSALIRDGAVASPARAEEAYLDSQQFTLAAHAASVIVYSSTGPRQTAHLTGVAVRLTGTKSTPDFGPILRNLNISLPETLTENAGANSYAAEKNFAFVLARSQNATTLSVWRRIESPQFVCEHLRPDLERCSNITMEPRIDYTKASPHALQAMYGLERFVRQCGLEPTLVDLMKLRASVLNGCAYCVDMHTKDARAHGETEQRLYAVSVWHEAPFFTDRERAALAWTDAVTMVSRDQVPDAVYNEVRRCFSEEEIVNLTMAVVTINGWNRLALAFRTPAGTYEPKS